MKATAHFSRSEAFAMDFGLDPDLELAVEIDLSQGPWINLTYNTLTDPGTNTVAWFNGGHWEHAQTGQAFSDVTIHFG